MQQFDAMDAVPEAVERLVPVAFPEWVPPGVASWASDELKWASEREAIAEVEVLRRLIFDPRMSSVWQEIYRANPGKHPGVFLHPAIVTALDPIAMMSGCLRGRARKLRHAGIDYENEAKSLEQEVDRLDAQRKLFPRMSGCLRGRARKLRHAGIDCENEAKSLEQEADRFDAKSKLVLATFRKSPAQLLQDMAAELFIRGALRVAIGSCKVVTSGQIKSEIALYGEVEKRLREAALILSCIGFNHDETLGLERLADKIRRKAFLEKRDPDDPIVVKRLRGDQPLRTCVLSLVAENRRIFGKPLHGTVATVTNVALQRNDITAERVHQMVRTIRAPGYSRATVGF